jgi:hypothetical protein
MSLYLSVMFKYAHVRAPYPDAATPSLKYCLKSVGRLKTQRLQFHLKVVFDLSVVVTILYSRVRGQE